MSETTDEAVEAAAESHRAKPGPMYWDFKCLVCDGLVSDHPTFWGKVLLKLRGHK